MRILIYGLNAAPELTGIGKYTGEMSSWLAARGHDVHLVTAPPYYPAWSIQPGFRNRYRTEHPEPNLTVHRCPLYVPRVPSGLKRMLHLASFALSSTPVALLQATHQPDIVFTVEPTFFGAPSALLAASLARGPAWLHVQDFEVDAAFDLGLLPSHGPVHTLALTLERIFTRAFDRVSTISHTMLRRALTKGVPRNHATLFPNWVDTDTIHPLPPTTPNPIRRQLALEDKTVLLYSGNMGNKQGLEILAPLAAGFAPSGPSPDPRLHFLFCGDGAFRPQLETLVQHLPNVTLLPLQPLDRLNHLLNAADIHLLPQRAGAADLVMPSKLTGMLSSGRPVLATALPGTRLADVVLGPAPDASLGLIVPPEDLPALRAAVARLASSPELRTRLGTNARAYALQHLSREQILLQLERDLLSLLTGSAPQYAPKVAEVPPKPSSKIA